MTLRMHHFLPYSRANGPGLRAVIWVQGCSLGCPGCFNPETHAFNGGAAVSVDDLFERIAALGDNVEGLSVSGGEPFQQLRPLTALLRRVRGETPLSIIVFTGFAWEEVRDLKSEIRNPKSEIKRRVGPEVLDYVDVLIAGRYDQAERVARGLRGSANKTMHLLTPRYTLDDLQRVPEAEIILSPAGDMLLSGMEPLQWTAEKERD